MNTQELTETEEKKGDHLVRIHIDRDPYESPNPTTGAALYILGRVHEGFQLYREATGNEEDEPIHNDNEKERLKQDEHFYSKKERHKGFDIIVNAEQHHVEKKRITYEQV